jgi:transposase
MIPIASGVRVWLAVGRTDMRRGMNGLALQVQEALRRDPHGGCPAFLLNIAERSLPRLTLRGGSLASKDAVS